MAPLADFMFQNHQHPRQDTFHPQPLWGLQGEGGGWDEQKEVAWRGSPPEGVASCLHPKWKGRGALADMLGRELAPGAATRP